MKSYFLKELKYQFKQLWHRWAKAIGQCTIALLISIGSVFFWTTDVGQRLDLWVLQKFFEIRGNRKPPEDITIVAVDDETYQKLDVSPRLPFPRILIAKALREIVKASPKVVIIDAKIPKEKIDPEADQILEESLRAGPTTIWSGRLPKQNSGDLSSDPSDYLIIGSEERFRSAAKLELPMLIRSNNGVVSRLTYDFNESSSLFDRVPISRPLVELAKLDIPLPGPKDLINFYGPSGAVHRIPLFKILENGDVINREVIQGKIILFGFQSVGRGRGQIDKDEYYVPVSSYPMFGVEIHANIVGNLIDQSWLKRFSLPAEMAILYVSSLIIGVVGIALIPEKGIPMQIVLVLGSFIYSYEDFSSRLRWHGGLGALIITSALTIIGSSIYYYVIIKSFKKYVKQTFRFETERDI